MDCRLFGTAAVASAGWRTGFMGCPMWISVMVGVPPLPGFWRTPCFL
jgi:hypothetical protein